HGLTDKAAVRDAARAMVPTGRAGDLAQAMMDLGASICRPKAPLCRACPVAADCRALAIGTPEHFPASKVRRTRPQRFGIAWWIECGGKIWLVRRPTKGMLGGMAALPGPEWQDDAAPVAAMA